MKESQIWETKFGEKLQKLKYGIEIAGMSSREGNCGREIEGVKLWELNCRSEIQGRQNVGSQKLKTIKGERKGE